MRYSREHKEATRERIVRAASRRFRTDGSAGPAIAGLMAELKLTHGGFYRHFSSKEQLFEEALEASVEEMSARMESIAAAAPAGGALPAIVDTYLSESHCANPGEGCPLAALGADIARLPRRSRDVCRRLLTRYATRLAAYMPGETHDARERYAVVLFTALAGTLTFARAVSDRQARARLLADARAFHRAAHGGGTAAVTDG